MKPSLTVVAPIMSQEPRAQSKGLREEKQPSTCRNSSKIPSKESPQLRLIGSSFKRWGRTVCCLLWVKGTKAEVPMCVPRSLTGVIIPPLPHPHANLTSGPLTTQVRSAN